MVDIMVVTGVSFRWLGRLLHRNPTLPPKWKKPKSSVAEEYDIRILVSYD